MNFNEHVENFEAKQRVIVEKSNEVERLVQEYKAEFKSVFGIADGEKMNVLEVIKAMAKVKELA